MDRGPHAPDSLAVEPLRARSDIHGRARWLLLLASVLVAAACAVDEPADATPTTDRVAGTSALREPARVLALTDLPPLVGAPSPQEFIDARDLATSVGCSGAVLSYSWPALESTSGVVDAAELEGVIEFQEGRVLYLGIQVLNTTVAELPPDLEGVALDASAVLDRFENFLEQLAPSLEHMRYLSIGNEVDVYLALHPDQRPAWLHFLEHAATTARRVAPGILVGTTVTERGAEDAGYVELVAGLDVHCVTFYHGRSGVDGEFEVADLAARRIQELVDGIEDDRPVVFQELGHPSHPSLAGEDEQARFVASAFEGLDAVRTRVPFVNWFLLYDFPPEFVRGQVAYYGLDPEAADDLTAFLGSLGLHRSDGSEKPGWQVFVDASRRWLGDLPARQER
jgi:hypothetical protein